MANHVCRGDTVQVISGAHKGASGKVLRVMPKKDLVVVEGVNMVYRHVRPTRQNPQGGRIQKEAPLHISNVLPVDERSGKGTRVRFEVTPDGGKSRLAVRSGGVIHQLRPGKSEG